jgi:hypothetical protein
MECGYSKLLCTQRNKNETIVSVIKRLFGELITSRLVKTRNRDNSSIAYNVHRLTTPIIIFGGFYCAKILLWIHYFERKGSYRTYGLFWVVLLAITTTRESVTCDSVPTTQPKVSTISTPLPQSPF